ncbi:hypothetical protein AQ505_08805 [Pedobacter sp. PACM 27299]|nr:hypothetical protein AQ505_08805 [Pedobacter sp. PACM 27299]
MNSFYLKGKMNKWCLVLANRVPLRRIVLQQIIYVPTKTILGLNKSCKLLKRIYEQNQAVLIFDTKSLNSTLSLKG